MKVMTIVGTRPEIIKMSRVMAELEKFVDHVLVHTGQNYDYELNEIFFENLGVKKPDYFLDVAGKSVAYTIGNVISKSDDIFDLDELEKQELSFKFHQFNDSIWRELDNVLLKLPFSKEKLLKKTKFIQKQDSIGLYLVAVKDVLKRNSIAPLSYVSPTIEQMILHNRKIQLIRKIEKTIIKDATQNNNFKIY